MELDDLKNIWKNSDPGFAAKGKAEITAMLKGNSKSIVYKLKRSVWIELGITLVGGVAMLIYAVLLPSGALKWTTVALLVMLVAYTVYYIKKLLLLRRFDPANDNLRENLERLVTSLSSYLKFYKRSYTILYPLYFGLGLLFGGLERGFPHFVETFSKPKSLAAIAVVALLFYVTSSRVVDWFLRKLYGNHLDKLKTLLHDLDS